MEGEQVTLTVKVTGSPTPTVTWLFNGKKVEDDYSTEVGKDGSLTLVWLVFLALMNAAFFL